MTVKGLQLSETHREWDSAFSYSALAKFGRDVQVLHESDKSNNEEEDSSEVALTSHILYLIADVLLYEMKKILTV